MNPTEKDVMSSFLGWCAPNRTYGVAAERMGRNVRPTDLPDRERLQEMILVPLPLCIASWCARRMQREPRIIHDFPAKNLDPPGDYFVLSYSLDPVAIGPDLRKLFFFSCTPLRRRAIRHADPGHVRERERERESWKAEEAKPCPARTCKYVTCLLLFDRLQTAGRLG